MNLQGVRKDIKATTDKLHKTTWRQLAVLHGCDVKWRMMYIQSESKHVINSLVDANVRLARLEEASVKQVSALHSLTTPPRVITRSYEVQDCSA